MTDTIEFICSCGSIHWRKLRLKSLWPHAVFKCRSCGLHRTGYRGIYR